MFHFPAFPPTALYIQAEVTGHDSSRVSPFGHPWITARLPAPQGFSQAPTSFIGFWCQGIHRVPLLTWPHKTRCSRPLCSSQGTGGSPGRIRSACRRLPVVRLRTGPRPKSPRALRPRASVSKESVARSLRTQQRVRRLPSAPAFHSPRGCTGRRRSSDATIDVPPMSTSAGRTPAHEALDPAREQDQMLLRKEVIQPHLPVRLPCYDFVPIADPTFDSSLPTRGLSHWLRVLPTFVT